MTIDRAIEILNPDHLEHYDGLDEVNEARRMGMEALKRTKWTLCSEGKPKDNEKCFVVRVDKETRTPFRDISWFKNGEWWNGIYDSSYKITHWMPWPELPEEE